MSDEMQAKAAAIETYVDAAAALHGLTIAAEWRPGVLAHMSAIEAMAGQVLALPLDDAVEAAPIFTP